MVRPDMDKPGAIRAAGELVVVRIMRRMPTHLTFDDHLDALRLSGAVLRAAAADAGLDAAVPTCAGWNVADLVAHQGMVHRWAAATVRGDADHRPDDSLAQAASSPDLLAWYSEGLDALIDALTAAPDDLQAMVMLMDTPPPRRFWARRQAHETTIHGVDAMSAALGRWPAAAEITLPATVAADGVDEILCGFVPRRKTALRSPEPFTVVVRTTDTGHAWSMRVSADPVVTTPGDDADGADAVFSGAAAEVYLGLWNRGDEMVAEGRPGVLGQWRSQVRVRWG